MSKQEVWTKQCPYVYKQLVINDLYPKGEFMDAPCGNYIPENYNICDHCMLRKYGLHDEEHYDSEDREGLNPVFYSEDVVTALRKAEDVTRAEVKAEYT